MKTLSLHKELRMYEKKYKNDKDIINEFKELDSVKDLHRQGDKVAFYLAIEGVLFLSIVLPMFFYASDLGYAILTNLIFGIITFRLSIKSNTITDKLAVELLGVYKEKYGELA